MYKYAYTVHSIEYKGCCYRLVCKNSNTVNPIAIPFTQGLFTNQLWTQGHVLPRDREGSGPPPPLFLHPHVPPLHSAPMPQQALFLRLTMAGLAGGPKLVISGQSKAPCRCPSPTRDTTGLCVCPGDNGRSVTVCNLLFLRG